MPTSSAQWLTEFERKVHSLVGANAENNSHNRVRIAILDSGLDGGLDELKFCWTRIKAYKSWVAPFPQVHSAAGLRLNILRDTCKDNVGHGTHLAALILRLHPWADLFVAQVTDSHNPNSLNVAEVFLSGPVLKQGADFIRQYDLPLMNGTWILYRYR